MSRDFSRGAVAALALVLSTSPAFADDLVEGAKKVEGAKRTLGNKVDALADEASQRKERAVEAAADAKERALEAAEEAKERGKEKVESLEERADEAKENAKAYANELKQKVTQRTQALGDDAKGMVAKTKLWFKQAIQGVRDSLRSSLLGAALALDNQAKDAREGARKAHWEKLKARYSLPDHAPTMEVSEELREHEERLARLRRARELAESVEDQVSVARADHLAEREYARHRRTLKRLLEKERREKALLDGEELPSEAEE
ncbi:MAG TPA: hypothetical protein VFX59_25650 [Polyangiales bacterium]|nr:hypothetical protein [Polyangiales bacterium]